MNGPLLGTFSIEGLRPLGTPAERSFELIHGTVADLVDPAHAGIFAEPLASRHGNEIDWYATIDGAAVATASLNEAERKALFDLLDSRLQAIRAVAGRLAERKGNDDQRLGEALSNACTYPGADSVFALRLADGTLQPVITNWAWTREAPRLVRGVLAGTAPRRESVAGSGIGPRAGVALAAGMGAIVPAAAGGAGGIIGGTFWALTLGWLLLAVLMATILLLMLAPCALRPALLGNHCPGAAEAPPVAAPADPSLLLAYLSQLERRLTLQQAECSRVAVLDRAEAWRMAQTPAALVPPEIVTEPDGMAPAPALTITEAPGPDTAAAPAATEEAERELEQRVAESAAAQGRLAFSLGWNSDDDLDLKVTCPSGEIVSYQTKSRTVCGGRLDIDANTMGTLTDRPIENIYFETVEPGRFQVTVRMHTARSKTEQAFSLRVKAEDGTVKVVTGSVSPDRREWSWSILIGE